MRPASENGEQPANPSDLDCWPGWIVEIAAGLLDCWIARIPDDVIMLLKKPKYYHQYSGIMGGPFTAPTPIDFVFQEAQK